MAAVDYEAAWLDFKAVITAKRSHGQRDLLTEMARIEVSRTIPEDQRGYDPAPRTKASTGRPRAGGADA